MNEIVRIAARYRGRIAGRGMSISATRVSFDSDRMWVDLSDGRSIGVPLTMFPRLLNAGPGERDGVEVSSVGLHWEALDEDVSIEGLLAGRGDQKSRRTEKAKE